MKKQFFLLFIFTLLMFLVISCTQKDSLNSSMYKSISVSFKTYFDLVNNEISETKDPSKFKLHLICPKTWEGDNGIYIKDKQMAMLVTQTVREVDTNTELNADSYKYFQRGDTYDFSDRECIVSKTDNGIPYVFYKGKSYTGMIIVKIEDKYMFDINIFEPIDENIFKDILNSIKLESN